MKKFLFTLEAVRTLRRRQEHVTVDQYVRALLTRQKAVEATEEMERKLEGNSGELGRVLSAGCTAAHAFQISNYHRFLEKQQEQRSKELAAAEQRLTAAFQTMLLARRQREIVEAYRKKQHTLYQRDVLREEQKALDELAGRRSASVLSWSQAESNV